MGDQSPGWKTPSDTLKKRIIRKKSSTRVSVSSSQVSTSHNSAGTSPRHGRAGKKRQNPFASNSQVKKLHLDTSDMIDSKTEPEASSLFNVLDRAGQGVSSQSQEERQQADNMREMLARLSKPLQSVENTTRSGQKKPTSPQTSSSSPSECSHYPVDWSLKSKLRYISPKPFSWCHPLKSGEESAGLIAFVQQQEEEKENGDRQDSQSSLSGENLQESKVLFQQASMVWMHPSLPWLRLFPRITGDMNIGKPSSALYSEEIQKTLLNDWTESFSSLFHLVRSRRCDYFYLCAHHFTVLFKSSGMPGLCEDLHAILTPSSRGLREALKNEGIDFFMPLNAIEKAVDNEDIECEPRKKTPGSDESGDELCDDDDKKLCDSEETGAADQDIKETDEGASSWLETLGIDRNKYRSLDPNKVKLQRDVYKIIDNRPESTLLVEGGETMALFNYLLNCRSCIDNTGELAGVPPTLLAPVAFRGATLRSMQQDVFRETGTVIKELQACVEIPDEKYWVCDISLEFFTTDIYILASVEKVKQGSVRQQQRLGVSDGYILEVTGAVLPCHVQRLNSLLQATQGEFNLSCRVQETSAPFNLYSKTVQGKGSSPRQSGGRKNKESGESGDSNDEDSVRPEPKRGAVNCRIADSNNGRHAIRELNYKQGSFTWS